jgi:hypothetical protein
MAEVVVSGKPLITSRFVQPTKTFRLKAGKKNHYHMHEGQTYVIGPGDTVELTEGQAQAFADKFDAVDGGFTSVDRAAGVVNREGGNVTSTDGVKTTTPGEPPAPQPESPKEDASKLESKKSEVKK